MTPFDPPVGDIANAQYGLALSHNLRRIKLTFNLPVRIFSFFPQSIWLFLKVLSLADFILFTFPEPKDA